MSFCDTCDIHEKLTLCCGRHPETGEQRPLILADGSTVMACPALSPEGRCTIYSHRPYGCVKHFCEQYRIHELISNRDFVFERIFSMMYPKE
jgi:hypothetical protein